MNENNKKEKDDLLFPEKIKTKKYYSSIISPKKEIPKNTIRNKKGVFQIQKTPNLLSEENNNQKNQKFDHNSPDLKIKSNDLNNLKSFQINLSNSNQNQKKYQKYSNNISNDYNNISLNLK